MVFRGEIRAAAALLLLTGPAAADITLLEDFSKDPAARWDYVSDRVMGGVSDGQAVFESADGQTYVQLTGGVSTKNNGGFIQVRRLLDTPFPAEKTGISLQVRGNGQRYFVHLRSVDTTRPWYYYQAEFVAESDWQDIQLPLSAFEPSHAVLPAIIDPQRVTSIGIVAYGRDHTADVSVASVELY